MNRTLKLKGTNLFSKERWDLIRKVVTKVNMVAMKASMLAKAYYLSQNQAIALDDDFYDLCIKVVTNTPLVFRGAMTDEKLNKQNVYNSMNLLFQRDFGHYINITEYSISHILGYVSTQFETAALNNIQFHFIKYLNLYMYKHLNGVENTVIASIRNHMLFDSECPEQYLDWVKEHKAFLMPTRTQSYDRDIEKRPWLYLRHMVNIVQNVEDNFPNTRLLSPLVLRRSYIPKHIHIDTNALVQLFMTKEKISDFVNLYELQNGVRPNIKTKADLGNSYEQVFGKKPPTPEKDFEYQQSFWQYLCRLDHPRLSEHELSFGNSINTDGCSVSLLLVENKEKKKFKPRKVNKNKKTDEFQHEVLPNTLFLGCDPGKSDLVAITDGAHTFKYTKADRDKDCQRTKYTRRSEAVRATFIIQGQFQSKTSVIPGYYTTLEDPTLLQYEQEILSDSSSRSCHMDSYIKYVRLKLYMEDEVCKLYETPRFRNDRFTRYTLTQSSEDKMLNRLQKFVRERHERRTNRTHDLSVEQNVNKTDYSHVNIFYGNWGRNPNLKNQAPTPGIGLRRKIDGVYNTITVSEHFTSKTCPCCKQRTLTNPALVGPTRKVTSKHHLLRCTHCSSWWNRNWAGAYNILVKGLNQQPAGSASA